MMRRAFTGLLETEASHADPQWAHLAGFLTLTLDEFSSLSMKELILLAASSPSGWSQILANNKRLEEHLPDSFCVKLLVARYLHFTASLALFADNHLRAGNLDPDPVEFISAICGDFPISPDTLWEMIVRRCLELRNDLPNASFTGPYLYLLIAALQLEADCRVQLISRRIGRELDAPLQYSRACRMAIAQHPDVCTRIVGNEERETIKQLVLLLSQIHSISGDMACTNLLHAVFLMIVLGEYDAARGAMRVIDDESRRSLEPVLRREYVLYDSILRDLRH
jgi:hypothetical protein